MLSVLVLPLVCVLTYMGGWRQCEYCQRCGEGVFKRVIRYSAGINFFRIYSKLDNKTAYAAKLLYLYCPYCSSLIAYSKEQRYFSFYY